MEKKSIFEDLNIPSHIYDEDEEALTSARAAAESNKKSDRAASSKVDEKAAVAPKPEIEQLEFKWDKKSTGSTDSLLQSDSEEVKRKFFLIIINFLFYFKMFLLLLLKCLRVK